MATAVYGLFIDRENASLGVGRLIEYGIAKDRLVIERATADACAHMDLTEDERQRFLDTMKAGSLVVRAIVPDEDANGVRMTMMRSGATTFLRNSAEDLPAPAPVDEVIHPGTIASTEFRDHFATEYAPTGASFEDYLPAYEFGYQFGMEAGHENAWKDWNQVFREARGRWEAEHPGTWDQYQLAIQNGWATSPVRLTGASLL